MEPSDDDISNPVLAFQNLTPEQMLDAVEQHGIQCDGRFLALNSYENRVYQIGVEDGSPIVAKFYRPARWSDAAILEEHAFSLELAAEEIPVIAPLVDAHGQSLHSVGPFRFSLYPCRGGRAPELDNPEHLEILGRFIGRIHMVGATNHYQHRPEINIQTYLTESADYLAGCGMLPPYQQGNWSTVIASVTENAEDCFQRAGPVAQLRLHGDLHHGNVMWTDNGPHIVDFDDARTGPAIQDLWMFLSGDRSYMSARLGDLLDGYSQFYDFNPAELHLIEALRSLRLVHHAAWLASRWDDPAFAIAFPWFNSEKYWEQLIADLLEQVQLMQQSPLVY